MRALHKECDRLGLKEGLDQLAKEIDDDILNDRYLERQCG